MLRLGVSDETSHKNAARVSENVEKTYNTQGMFEGSDRPDGMTIDAWLARKPSNQGGGGGTRTTRYWDGEAEKLRVDNTGGITGRLAATRMAEYYALPVDTRYEMVKKIWGEPIGIRNTKADFGTGAPVSSTYDFNPKTIRAATGAVVRYDPNEKWTQDKESSALQSALGIPMNTTQQSPYASTDATHFMMHQALPRNSRFLMNVIIQQIPYSKLWEITELLPPVKFDSGLRIDEVVWRFNSHTTSRKSYETVSRLVTSTKEMRSTNMMMFGVANRSNSWFYRTPAGSLHFAMQQVQIKNAITETMRMMNMIAVVQGARSVSPDSASPPAAASTFGGSVVPSRLVSESELGTKIVAQLHRISEINKSPFALDNISIQARDTIYNASGRTVAEDGSDLTMIVPRAIFDLSLRQPEHAPKNSLKPGDHQMDAKTSKWRPIGVGEIRASSKYPSGTKGAPDIDTLVRHRSWGAGILMIGVHPSTYDASTRSKFTTDQCNTRTVFLDTCTSGDISFRTFFEHSMLYNGVAANSDLSDVGVPFFFDWSRFGTGNAEYTKLQTELASRDPSHRFIFKPDEIKWMKLHARPLRWGGRNNGRGFCHTVGSLYSKSITNVSDPLKAIGERLWNLDLSVINDGGHFKQMLSSCTIGDDGNSPSSPFEIVAALNKRGNPDSKTEAASAYQTWLSAWPKLAATISLWTCDWFMFCLRHDVPIFLNGAACMDNIVTKMADILVVKPGRELGLTAIGRGSYETAWDITGAIKGEVSYSSAPHISRPELTCLVRNAGMLGIERGASNSFYTRDDLKHREGRTNNIRSAGREKSMYAVMFPYGFDISTLKGSFDIRGHWGARPVSDYIKTNEPLHYPTAPLYTTEWKRQDVPSYSAPITDLAAADPTNSTNTVLSLWYSCHTDANGIWRRVVRNQGPIGETVVSGIAMKEHIDGLTPLRSAGKKSDHDAPGANVEFIY